jgi:hypothetical protein
MNKIFMSSNGLIPVEQSSEMPAAMGSTQQFGVPGGSGQITQMEVVFQ